MIPNPVSLVLSCKSEEQGKSGIMWRGRRKESKSPAQLRLKNHTAAWVGGGHGWSVLGGLRCQTQKEQQSQGQGQEPGLEDDNVILLQSLGVRDFYLVCLFLKGRLGHRYLPKPSLSKLNLPVSKRQGWVLQWQWFGLYVPACLASRQHPHQWAWMMGLCIKESGLEEDTGRSLWQEKQRVHHPGAGYTGQGQQLGNLPKC